jgi:small basic protein (TIGR04137 family)
VTSDQNDESGHKNAKLRARRMRTNDLHLYNSGGDVICRLLFTLQLFSLHFMSQHRSLRGASTIAAKRNVLKRFERVELLKKRGQWKEGRKVIGLPKTKPEA